MEGNPVPQDGDDKKADRFELMTALLLGFAALGAALASLQGGQWGGRQLEAFSESNTMTTVAAIRERPPSKCSRSNRSLSMPIKGVLTRVARPPTA